MACRGSAVPSAPQARPAQALAWASSPGLEKLAFTSRAAILGCCNDRLTPARGLEAQGAPSLTSVLSALRLGCGRCRGRPDPWRPHQLMLGTRRPRRWPGPGLQGRCLPPCARLRVTRSGGGWGSLGRNRGRRALKGQDGHLRPGTHSVTEHRALGPGHCPVCCMWGRNRAISCFQTQGWEAPLKSCRLGAAAGARPGLSDSRAFSTQNRKIGRNTNDYPYFTDEETLARR